MAIHDACSPSIKHEYGFGNHHGVKPHLPLISNTTTNYRFRILGLLGEATDGPRLLPLGVEGFPHPLFCVRDIGSFELSRNCPDLFEPGGFQSDAHIRRLEFRIIPNSGMGGPHDVAPPFFNGPYERTACRP